MKTGLNKKAFKIFSKKGYYIDKFPNGTYVLNRILKQYDSKEEAEEDLLRILAHEIKEEEL